MSVIAETILFPFMNRMNLTVDSINVVPLNAQNGLFFERRVIRTNNTHPSPFLVALNIRHTVWYVNMRVCAQTSGSQLKVGPMAHRPLTLAGPEDHAVAHSTGPLVALLLYLGCTY